MRRFLFVLLIMILIPYVTTLAWTGRLESLKKNPAIDSGNRKVVLEDGRQESSITVEEYLVHVLAAQIPADFETETLKAQAVLARTYIYGLMEKRTEIYEEELDMDALSAEQMKKLWGETDYPQMLAKLQNAVNATAGLYLLHDGQLIAPLFCYASAGKTRSYGDDFPYLKQAESTGDLLAENYRSMPVFEVREFVRKINEIPGAMAVSEEELEDDGGIQIVERDSSGYVKLVQIGQKTYTGEEVQYALGLASSCYSFERLDGKIRVICKGVGHGFGFAQFGANEMAKEGKTYEELLNHYFQNVEIVSVQ
ncbi:MAG: SpoIID/LytB domain-containing protein [Lachnoclostridium sp.]|nr:SpoIID/LytB domain-containing protein [Lachnoclostridium sp.]